MSMKHFLYSLFLILFLSTASFFVQASSLSEKKDEVRRFIQTNYVNAAYNDLELDRLDVGFSESLKMQGYFKGSWKSMTLAEWKAFIFQQIHASGFKKASRQYDVKFKAVNIDCDEQNHCLSHVELHLLQNKQLKFVDHLMLTNSIGTWQIIAKSYLAVN